jgi:HlyD family secretion protein
MCGAAIPCCRASCLREWNNATPRSRWPRRPRPWRRPKAVWPTCRKAGGPEEVQVIEAELASAEAQAREAAREADRLRALLDRGTVAQSQVDDADTRLAVAEARVAEVRANLEVARLPARPHEIAAAEAAVAQAEAHRAAAAWHLEKRALVAPAAGKVFEILRRAGEIAGPDAPVLSLLPEGAVVLRLYVPEPNVSAIAPGTTLLRELRHVPAGHHRNGQLCRR